MAGSCEQSNKPSGSMKGKDFLGIVLHGNGMLISWRINPLLRDYSVKSDRCYVASATYTQATTEQRG
jgi:hypothetical protein